MSAHTPGPWEFVPDGLLEPNDMGGIRAASGWVCTFGDNATYYPTEGMPPEPANARLIAASPDLLAACEMVAASALRGSAYDACVAAIAKARGAA